MNDRRHPQHDRAPRGATTGPCPPEERFIERASGRPDADLEAHVASCARCRDELETYRTIFRGLREDVRREEPASESEPSPAAHDPHGPHRTPPDRREIARDRPVRNASSRVRGPRIAAVAALLVVVTAASLAIVRALAPGNARVECNVARGSVAFSESRAFATLVDGDVRFSVAPGPPFEVRTPIGTAASRHGTFRLEVSPEKENAMPDRLESALRLTVLAGVVAWTAEGATRELRAGETLVLEPESKTVASVSASPVDPMSNASPTAPGAAPVPRPQPRSEETPPGATEASITATVVDRATDEPIAGATVFYAVPQEDGSALVARAITDGDGHCEAPLEPMSADEYAATELARWHWQDHPDLSVRHAEFVPIRRGTYFPRGVPRTHVEPVPVGTIDLGTLQLDRGARVSGVVEDDSGMPVADARIYVASWGGPDLSRPFRLFESGTSGSDGRFTVPDRVNGHGRSDSTLLAMTECGLGWVRLDFPSHVREFEGARIRLAPSASARITITDVDGAPVADALVVARPLDLPLGPGPEDRRAGDAPYFEDDDPDGPAGLFRAWTGDDGRVELACLPTASEASTYSFWVLSEDHVLTSVGPRTIEPGSSIALDIVLERVVPTPIEGSVTTRDGLPIEGARVIVLGETIETDADGRYTFPGVVTRANRVGVHVRADGFENDHRILDLEPGTPLDPVDFSLRRATTTSGRLVDASGRALGGVPLGFRDEADFGRAVRIDDHETDADGRFTASKTDDGWWIPDPLFLPDPRPGHAWSYNRLPAVLGGSEGIDIVVPDYRLGETTLIARLVDADSGEPIAPRRANFYFSHEAPVSNWYDARPRLQADRIVAEGLWPGDWKLCVLTDDGRGAIQMVHVEPGDTSLDLRVEIGNPAVVWGRVVWNGIEPRDGVRVFAQPKGPRISPGWNATDGPEALASGDVDLDGSFRLANVLPGDTVLSFHGVPGFAAEVPLIVASGGEHEIDVIFEPRTDVGFRSAAPIVGQSFLLRVRSLDGIDLDPIGPRTDLERFTSQLPKAPPTAPIRATLSLPEGRYAWECTFPRHPRTPGSRIIAEPQSGEFTVVEGEPLEILIPVLPID